MLTLIFLLISASAAAPSSSELEVETYTPAADLQRHRTMPLREDNIRSSIDVESDHHLFSINAHQNYRTVHCGHQPSICSRAYPHDPANWHCCQGRCLNIYSHKHHCGKCGIKCHFPLTCCKGHCVNTNTNRKHCGDCYTKCPHGVKCEQGMCGYSGY
ncbi:hypothetical protein O6H91_23G057100 [Diphasiastrum complanatum]|uniref:Uncharacterized protein n=1 Tax=Diphasiastrum complanatum TaxID=34168 RepID=A0ACC2AB31_DIPCM|nr:hypothetical protein O6H91_23G057100 [Diphasiastrum complanatum]